MISPSPAQQKPDREVKPEEKKVKSTPSRRRTGQTPAALFVKAIFRPIFKGIYYLLRAIRNNKLATLILIIVFLGSGALATYVVTRTAPLGIGSDQFHFQVNGKGFNGEHVKNWLYALRDGDVATMSLIGQETAQYIELVSSVANPTSPSSVSIDPRNPTALIGLFSQAKTHLTWKTITVIGVSSAPDTTLDSFVEVDTSSSGPGGNVGGIMIWHFVTAPTGTIIAISLVSFRAPL